MPSQVSLQADVVGVPGTAVDLLRSLSSVLRALSADGVSPLALVQLEAIGCKFLVSGPLARQIPDALTRSSSTKLGKLQTLVGWMPNDTTTTLAQTAGGQASALLIVGLVEMFCRNSTGHLLFDLSMKILPQDCCLASMGQLSDIAQVVSNKLKPLAFGQHHATHVTRIRETYHNSNIMVSPSVSASLLDRLTVDAIVEILDAVQQALRDANVIVQIKGFRGLGGIISLLMALCPDDVLLLVENGIIFEGQRRSVIVSVQQKQQTTLHVEKLIRGSKSSMTFPLSFRPDEFLAQPGRLSSYDHLTMRIEGCMTRMAEQILGVTLGESDPIIVSFVGLIGGIMVSFTGADFGPNSDFPRDGLRSLLGSHASQHVRDRLRLLFGVVPELKNIDLSADFKQFYQSLNTLAWDSALLCSHCDGSHQWAKSTLKGDSCRLCSIWGAFGSLVGNAVLLCLIETDLEALPIPQQPRAKLGPYLCRRLLHRVHNHPNSQRRPGNDPDTAGCYTIQDVHTDLCQLLGYIPTNSGQWHHVLGTSNGSTSTLPHTLEMSLSRESRLVRYWVLDGQFHDGRNYYTAITETTQVQPRPPATDSIIHPQNVIYPSPIGAHKNLTLSLRPHHNSLELCARISFQDHVLEMSFYDTHLAYMATSMTHACNHDPSGVVALSDATSIIATGVEAPVSSDERTSVVLTHGDKEAQFLAGVLGIPSLFQGGSCLNCMLQDANAGGFRLLIQS
ncbi:hypothetical protein F5Y03DRAFT_406603 [Xylaria venustula]|nr:hypothetical protein F5Y03DRAFT_406603 [Xylaria venustula]